MAGVNEVRLIGNLGADPETTQSSGGMAITKLRIATAERKKVGGEWTDHTEWHRVTLFGKQAEFASEWLAKGSKVYIAGRLRTSKWQDKDGNDRYTTEIIGDRFENLTPRNQSPQQQQKPADPGAPFDDDIPF